VEPDLQKNGEGIGLRNPVFCQPGFFSWAKTDIPSTKTPKKPGFCEKPGFCWGQLRAKAIRCAACNIAQKMATLKSRLGGTQWNPTNTSGSTAFHPTYGKMAKVLN
jgi:hypothetical protein